MTESEEAWSFHVNLKVNLVLRLHLHDKLYRSMQKAADSFRQGAGASDANPKA